MPEGLFAPLERCLSLLVTIRSIFHMVLAQYFEPWIVYIFSLLVQIHLGQS
jgi:hypothetical protein